jgi:hypothetical protein
MIFPSKVVAPASPNESLLWGYDYENRDRLEFSICIFRVGRRRQYNRGVIVFQSPVDLLKINLHVLDTNGLKVQSTTNEANKKGTNLQHLYANARVKCFLERRRHISIVHYVYSDLGL